MQIEIIEWNSALKNFGGLSEWIREKNNRFGKCKWNLNKFATQIWTKMVEDSFIIHHI